VRDANMRQQCHPMLLLYSATATSDCVSNNLISPQFLFFSYFLSVPVESRDISFWCYKSRDISFWCYKSRDIGPTRKKSKFGVPRKLLTAPNHLLPALHH